MHALGYWLLLIMSILSVYFLWKTDSIGLWNSSVHAKALIHFDLSIPSSSSSSTPDRPSFDSPHRRQRRSILSNYMLQLYYRRPKTDIVKAIRPAHISVPLSNGGRILEFTIPSPNRKQSLETAEFLGIAGAIIKVQSFQNAIERNGNTSEILKSRKDDVWRVFDVTSTVVGRSSDTVKLYVHGKIYSHSDGPILLLNYSKTYQIRRQRRSAQMDQKRSQEDERRTKGNFSRRRHRDACRRRPLYVDFALISYDKWVVAPPGYEAFQCTGKCFLPFADHLNSTSHAIVQTLMYGILQHLQANENSDNNKVVGRACCVPTQLDSTSLLYLDSKRSMTYEYSYENMVVVECGCR